MKTANEIRTLLVDSGEFDPNTEYLDAATLLIVGLHTRHHLHDLHRATGISKTIIKVWKRRLITNGIWTGETQGSQTLSDWYDAKYGDVAFFCDVMVALGHLQKRWSNES